MLRLVCKADTAEIVPDIAQTADGRGRYICSAECAEKLHDVKILRRAFRMNLTLEKAEALLKALEECKCDPMLP
jgi:predicted RNA-binding protein YlxR (DUF448 family)